MREKDKWISDCNLGILQNVTVVMHSNNPFCLHLCSRITCLEYFNKRNTINQSTKKTEHYECIDPFIYGIVYALGVTLFYLRQREKRLLFCHASSSDRQKIRVSLSREILTS